MSDDMHPEVAAVLQQAQRLQSLMDDQLAKMNTETFTATDESETVEVTLNGHHWLTDVFIEDGVLRLGAEVVQSRVNEALQKASAVATESITADRERIDAAVAEITADMNDVSRAN
jgi:DNA-binding protein YbaB